MKIELKLLNRIKFKSVLGLAVITYAAVMAVAVVVLVHALFFSAVFWSVRLMNAAL